MKPIRILHYIGSLESGGSQAMIMEIYRNIDRNKIQFDFVVDRKKNFFYQKEIEKYGGKIYFLNDYFKGYNLFRYKKQWKDFFKNHDEYRIIHCHVRSVASIVLKIAKKNQLKTICHSHGASNGTGIKAFVKKKLQSRIPRFSDYLLACSIDSAVWLYGKDYVESGKCIIIKNGIDTKKFEFNSKYRYDIRKKYNIENDDILIGHVGRFDPIKNHEFIVKLGNDLCKYNKRYKFMLCGDGEEKIKIIKKIKELGLDNNFIFIEPTNEIYKYYNAFDLFILPSVHEGLGIVLIEAQYNGLTCLVSHNIPNEACISNRFLKKELVIVDWSNYIKNNINYNRKELKLNENSNNYDIKNSCKQLVKLYYSL